MSNVPVTPNHYRSSKFQASSVIRDWGLSFELGNVLKYVQRAGKKNSASQQEDLQKALWYLLHEIHGDAMVVDYIVTNQDKLRELSLRMAIKIGKLIEQYPDRWERIAKITLLKQ